MELLKVTILAEGGTLNDWEIHEQVVGVSKNGVVTGVGSSLKAKDVYGSSTLEEGCSKHCQVEREREKANFDSRMKEMEEKYNKMEAILSQLLPMSNSNTSTQSPNMV
jgi:hypothetical protein